MDGAGARFEMVGEEVVHRGWIITVTKATILDPDGTRFERDVVRHPGAVAVVAVTDAGSMVMVRQYRPALDQWLLEIPAGTCDVKGEPELAVARRELAEEVGYAATTFTLLTRCAITPGFCDEISAVYLATGLSPVPLDRQGIEERHMGIEELPIDRFDALVDDGSIIDATTILGVGLAVRHLAAG
jgi:8-oxo-dGTP pyrophosphatase MutT (NUDIX family)